MTISLLRSGLSLVKQSKFLPIVDRVIACSRNKSSLAKIDFNLFKQQTGLTLLSPTRKNLNPFKYGLNVIMGKNFKAPEGLDAVLIGHGEGSFRLGTWRFGETQQNVMEYLNSVLKRGQRVLALTCETANNATTATPGIGNIVKTTLDVPTNPAKIVEVGKGIIGHFVNGKAVYY